MVMLAIKLSSCLSRGLTFASTGVRYPAHLLPLVVATLTSMQSLMPAQNHAKEPLTAAELSGGTTLQADALKAAAMGAGGALRTEAVSPIDKKSLTKAFRLSVSICSMPLTHPSMHELQPAPQMCIVSCWLISHCTHTATQQCKS